MSMLGIALPVAIWLLALGLARREWTAFKRSRSREENSSVDADLFVYSAARLRRRAAGILTLVATGATLLAFETMPPASLRAASAYMAVFLCELAVFIAVPILDLRETAKTARPGGVMRPVDLGRQTRRSPRRPQ